MGLSICMLIATMSLHFSIEGVEVLCVKLNKAHQVPFGNFGNWL